MHGAEPARIQAALERFLGDAGCAAALLIDRVGASLAAVGAAPAVDMGAVATLAAGVFGSTAALARLLGETEFSVSTHEGARQSLHVSTIDDGAMLLALFDERTTVGMVRAFAREASTTIGAILAEARTSPRRADAVGAPRTPTEARGGLSRRSS